MYPEGHPYHDAVYGPTRTSRPRPSDVKDFFATYYVPNNASLVVAGDFDSAEVKPHRVVLRGNRVAPAAGSSEARACTGAAEGQGRGA